MPTSPSSSSSPGAVAHCPQCGYSIVGLAGVNCPECGVDLITAIRRAERQERNRRQTSGLYVRAALGLLVGWGIVVVNSVVLRGTSLGLAVMPGYLAISIIAILIGLGVFYVCSLLWIGFDQPFAITALRLAAIYAITDAAYVLMRDRVPVIGWFICTTLYLWMLMKWLELEGRDALAVALFTGLAKVALGLALAAMFNR